MSITRKGVVYLVGAGPGDPGLITVKGMKLLEAADVVLFDRLVDKRLLTNIRIDAIALDVGKSPGEETDIQDYINSVLLSNAREDKIVVRLKGGDPFVFGRGGEEALFLKKNGVPFEIVPGITSAIAAPAYAGIPVTHRNIASSFTVVTGTESPEKIRQAVNWSALARSGGSLIVLMGWSSIDLIVDRLLGEGLDGSTPASLIEWGTKPFQRKVVGTLETIIDKGQSCALAPPICAVFGEVVNLHEEIQWFESLPLFGKKLLVTRSREQISSLTNRLESYGADVLEVPTIKIDPLEDYAEFDQIIERLQDFHWIVFTSTNTVEFFLRRVRENGYDLRFLNGVKLAAIGESTAKSLSDKGLIADLVSFKAVSEGLVYEIGKMEIKNKQILLPGSNIKRQVISEGLENLGAEVKDILVYRTSHIPDVDNRLEEALDQGIEIVTFTSSSTVKGLAKILGGNLDKLSTAKIACIGPITAAEVQRYGLTVDILAEKSSVAGLVDSIVDYCNGKGLLNG